MRLDCHAAIGAGSGVGLTMAAALAKGAGAAVTCLRYAVGAEARGGS